MTIFRIYNTEKEAGAGTEELNWLKETVWSIGKSEEKSYLIYWTLALNLFIQVYYDKGLELVKRANGSVSNKTVLEWIANQVLTFDQQEGWTHACSALYSNLLSNLNQGKKG